MPNEEVRLRPHPRTAEALCAREIVRMQEYFFNPLQQRLMFARDRRLDWPFATYIDRVILPQVRCPRLALWLRVRAHDTESIPPYAIMRTSALYVANLEREFNELVAHGAFADNGWRRTWGYLYGIESARARR